MRNGATTQLLERSQSHARALLALFGLGAIALGALLAFPVFSPPPLESICVGALAIDRSGMPDLSHFQARNFVSPPTAENPTVIDASGTYTITVSSPDVAQSLTINDAGATILDENGGSLTLGGALAINAGIFELDGGMLAGVSTLTMALAA